MTNLKQCDEPEISEAQNDFLSAKVHRRSFLQYAGVGAATVALVAAGCDPDEPATLAAGEVDLGSGDVGILNYAYALEQLEAAFYEKVASKPVPGFSEKETLFFNDIRDHEVAHREFFKNVLTSLNVAIPPLEFDFSSIDFNSRTNVLAVAKAFEDLGVSAYNGAGPLMESGTYLLLAGKIVSVEARHAATIRDLINYGDFVDSDVVDASGLDVSRMPKEVLMIADTYIVTKINADNLPTS